MVTEYDATKDKQPIISGRVQDPEKEKQKLLKKREQSAMSNENLPSQETPAENTPANNPPSEPSKHRGRPKGSKNNPKVSKSVETSSEANKKGKRGRPKGSKNKPKVGRPSKSKATHRRGRPALAKSSASQFIVVTPKGRGFSTTQADTKSQVRHIIEHLITEGKNPKSISIYRHEGFRIDLKAPMNYWLPMVSYVFAAYFALETSAWLMRACIKPAPGRKRPGGRRIVRHAAGAQIGPSRHLHGHYGRVHGIHVRRDAAHDVHAAASPAVGATATIERERPRPLRVRIGDAGAGAGTRREGAREGIGRNPAGRERRDLHRNRWRLARSLSRPVSMETFAGGRVS